MKERRVVVLLWCCFGLNESQCLVLCAHAAVADDDDDDDDHDHDSDAADSNECVDDVVFFLMLLQLMTLYFKLGHGDQIWFLWCVEINAHVSSDV